MPKPDVSVAEKFEDELLNDDKFIRMDVYQDVESGQIKEIQHWVNKETTETVFLLDYGANGADLLKNNPKNDIHASLEYVGVDTE